MGHWIETVIRINDNGGEYRWEILTLDEGMVTLRYSEPDPETKSWVVKQEVEMIADVAKAIFKDKYLPMVEDIDD